MDQVIEPPQSASGPVRWTTAEIVYVSIAGVLMLMAFAEIVCFTGSLSYSFIKVHQKAKAAKQRGVQYMSLFIMFVFYILRILFLGAMLSLVPVPHWQGMSSQPEENHLFFPSPIMVGSQYFAFGLVGLLLVMPTVISVRQLMTSPGNVKEQLEAIRSTNTFPRVLIVMPVYNELPEVLHVAICSAIDGDYPKEHLHIFISFDNDAVSDLYRALIRNLGVPADNEYYPPVLDLYFRGVQITVSRFPHGGKRLTQKKTFSLINSIYKEYPEKTDHLFILFIDSDILLHPSTIANFVWDMQLRPNSKDLLAMTGVITVTTKEDMTFLNLLQDIEYVHGQLIGRAIESAVGACVTLPGALTIFRYSAFLKSYDEYFAERSVSDLWDFGRSHLGEDRYLTHLLMTKAQRPKLIQFCHRATCKTEPVREWKNLIKQRRRWFLGFLTNEGAFLSDPHLWKKYPWLLTFRLIQDIVNGTSMVSFVTVAAIATGMQNWSLIWLGLLVAYFVVNQGLMFTYGIFLGRKKAWLYPMMFIVGPFVTWYLLVHGVITANERTWGGPRADAGSSTDEEKQAGENGGERASNEDDYNDEQGLDGEYEDGSEYSEEEVEQIELPDHLFYPNQQQPTLRRRRKKSQRRVLNEKTEHDADSNPFESEANNVVTTSRSFSSKGKGRVDSPSFEGMDENQADENTNESDDESESDVDVLDALEQSCHDYFAPRPFANSQVYTAESQWWESSEHLTNLGIVPFIHQPKIPAMFASAETLILSPVVPTSVITAAVGNMSTTNLSISIPSDSTVSLDTSSVEEQGRGTAPSTPKMAAASRAQSSSMSAPGTPKRRTQMTLPRSKTASQIVGSTPPSPGFAISRRQSTHSLSSAIPLPPNYAPSPKPSFRYIPVSYITPANSEPATPRMSPMLPPTAFFSPSAPGSGSSSPQRPSSPSRGSFSSIRLPPAAVTAALAQASSSSSTSSRRLSSRSRVFQPESAVPPVPAIPFPAPPSFLQEGLGQSLQSRSSSPRPRPSSPADGSGRTSTTSSLSSSTPAPYTLPHPSGVQSDTVKP